MCSSPLRIINPTRNYYRGLTPGKVTVPCGRCPSCRANKRNDWFVRANAEYEYYTKVLHGQVYFVTLTYDNEHLPHFNLRDRIYEMYDSLEFGIDCPLPPVEVEKVMERLSNGKYVEHYKLENIPCFSVHDVQNFLKQLRIDIDRHTVFDSEGIKYLICSEFGKKFGRPHYHALFYLPFEINANTFISMVRNAWRRGICSYSRDFPFALRNSLAIKYTTKYITKDFSFAKKYDLDYYLNFANQYDILADLKKDIKSVYPFHLQSIGFGSPLLSQALKDFPLSESHNKDFDFSGFELSVDFISNQLHVDSDKYIYSFPEYIRRKVLFDKYVEELPIQNAASDYQVEHGKKPSFRKVYTYIPNQRYLAFLGDLYDRQLKSVQDYLYRITSSSFLNLNKLTYEKSKISHFELLNKVRNIRQTYDIQTLSEYLLVYRFMCRDSEFDIEELKSMTPKDLWIAQKSYYNWDNGRISFPISALQSKFSAKVKLLDNENLVCDYFRDLENVILDLEDLLAVHCKFKDAYKQYEKDIKDNAKIEDNLTIYHHV